MELFKKNKINPTSTKKRLKSKREQLGITQEEISEYLDIELDQIQKYEGDK